VPNGVAIRVMESTPETYYVALPARPEELSDEMLDRVAGGIGDCYCVSFCCNG
jgi:hypothetical protein